MTMTLQYMQDSVVLNCFIRLVSTRAINRFLDHFILVSLHTVVYKKTCHFYFLNSFAKRVPILIIFNTRHHDRT